MNRPAFVGLEAGVLGVGLGDEAGGGAAGPRPLVGASRNFTNAEAGSGAGHLGSGARLKDGSKVGCRSGRPRAAAGLVDGANPAKPRESITLSYK